MRDVLVGFTALVNILIHAITMRSHVTFEIIGEIDRPMAAMELPSTLSIGTPTAFGGYYEYHFRFVDEINMYVCDYQTTTHVPGEVMALQAGSDENGNTWYLASEGRLSPRRFHGRQIVFRTREQFWVPGTHEWQMNANSSAINTNNNIWGDSMQAVTKVAEDASMVFAAVGLLGAADA